jgi:tetratricopeptide (TPR) repeat protein
MRKQVKGSLKITTTIVAILISFSSYSQEFSYRLKMADSLYVKKQYTQSLELYQQIFDAHTYSAAMLLKMAFIEEALGQNAKALYYINLYYDITHDQTALHKMDDMAARYNLSGYELSQTDHTLAIINENRTAITTALSGLCILLVGLMIFTLRRKKTRPYMSFSFFILSVILLIAFTNIDLAPANGITQNAPAYLMSGPSAGAKVVGIVNEGNRLPIRGRHDVWVKVKWRDGYAYLKENQVLEVKL